MDEIGRVRNLLYSHNDILPSVLKDDSPGVFPVARCSPRGGCLFLSSCADKTALLSYKMKAGKAHGFNRGMIGRQ